MSNMKLECPHCFYTIEVERWNKELENSLRVGRAEELIPDELQSDKWEEYQREHSFVVDCPECGEVCVSDDIQAF